jgi:hypothetical protein
MDTTASRLVLIPGVQDRVPRADWDGVAFEGTTPCGPSRPPWQRRFVSHFDAASLDG